MRHHLRRCRRPSVATLLSVVLVAILAVTGTASAARDRPASSASSQWLAKQLKPDGTLDNPLGSPLPDQGLMIDVLLAMYASGDGKLARPIMNYVDEHASDYFTWDGLAPGQGFDQIIVGGAAAKIMVAAEVAGRDPRDIDGYDLVEETRLAIMRSGPDKGRVSNYSKNPDFAGFVSNEANTFGQSLAVIGLAGVGEIDQLALGKLLTQQCSEGYFRIFFEYIPTTETGDHVNPAGYKVSTCDEGKPFDKSPKDGDSTGMALSALLAARKAGAQGLDGPIARTVAWLKANQDTGNGGWGGGVGTEAVNTNSTGLIVQALADAGGSDAEVTRGQAFLKSAQVTAADADTVLSDQVGAIAYTPAAYQAARKDGLGPVDAWVRAGAQASLGISQVGFYDLVKENIPADPPPPPPSPVIVEKPVPVPTTEVRETVRERVVRQTVRVARPPGSTRGTVVTPPVSQAQPAPSTPAGDLGRYLVGKLVNGDHIEVTQDGKTFVDYDLTADLVLALRTLGEQPEAVERVSRFLLTPQSTAAYAHGAPYEQGEAAYAEPLAKLWIIARFLGEENAALGTDLAALRSADGRFTDKGAFADTSNSVQRQVWATLATVADSESDAGPALDLLISRQCQDGTFPISLTTEDCETGDPAATAMAVLALNARRAGAQATDLTPPRANALRSAAVALTGKVDRSGLVLDGDGQPNLVLSAVVAAGRQAAGLDVTDTSKALGASLLSDGGLARSSGVDSDVAVSIASASGVAGKAWLSAEGSPVVPAMRLPLVVQATSHETGSTSHSALSPLGMFLLGAVLGVAGLVGGRFAFGQYKSHKGVAS